MLHHLHILNLVVPLCLDMGIKMIFYFNPNEKPDIMVVQNEVTITVHRWLP